MQIISSIAALLLPIGVSSCYVLVASSILMLLAIIDFNLLILPDSLTQTLLWLSLLHSVICDSGSTENTIVSIALGYTLFWLLRNLGGMYYNCEVIGGGDVKLVAALTGCLGWSLFPYLLLISYGITLVLVPFFSAQNIKERYPFGIGLAIAGIILLFWRVYVEQSSGMYLPFESIRN